MSNPFDDPNNLYGGETKMIGNPFDDNTNDGGYSGFVSSSKRAINNTNNNPQFSSDDPSFISNQSSSFIADDIDTNPHNDPNMHSVDAPAEALWQYLGDLPYRRVPIYSNVSWERRPNVFTTTATSATADGAPSASGIDNNQNMFHYGLASFPPSSLKYHPKILDQREVRTLLNNTTHTIVCGCPNGGPIAAITLPVVGTAGSAVSGFLKSQINIWTNSGKCLAQLDFPPDNKPHEPPTTKRYTAADVLTMGFTTRTTLIILLRDSMCYTYDLRGDAILPPFLIMPRGGDSSSSAGTDLLLAHVYEGGVAVLATNKDSAIVELFDDHDDPNYIQTAHISARKITPVPASTATDSASSTTTHDYFMSQHFALITLLPTGSFANQNFCHYCAIAVLSRLRTASKHPEIFLSTSDNSVITVDAATMDITDVNCRQRIPSPIVDMCFAPNGRFLACFTESSMLTVISTSFETKVLDFDTSEGSNMPPLEMKWCGEDSVVLHWKNLGVLMIGPYGDWLRFPYEGTENLYLIPEIDCCRVITDSAVEILQRVPPATALLLRIGSIEASAMLLDAADAFYAGSPTSDEAARTIIKTGMLTEAIETCTDSAMKEFDIHTQKRLLRAASYGMHFSYKTVGSEQRLLMGGPTTGSDIDSFILPSETTVKFVNAARKLRVLNALRNPNVGFVLTSAQYDAMTATGVVARLIGMKRPALATGISKYLGLPKSVQLFARASKAAALAECDKGLSDVETAEAAIRIINGETDGNSSSPASSNSGAASSLNRGGFATVAMAFSKTGRPGVANLLLKLESSVADKVPALISTGAYAEAMAVATSARDLDFIFSTLMEYERSCMTSVAPGDVSKAQAVFLSTVVSKFTTESFHTLRRYLQTTSDVKSVTNLLLRAQKFTDAGEAMAKRALGEDDYREKQGMLGEASRIFSLGKETAFHKSCTDDYLELLKDQEVIRTKYGVQEVCPSNSSVTETIASVIHYAAVNVREQHRLLADADKLAKKYRIPEKRLWHIKVKAFADSQQWSNLRILADSRSKPPIGFKPFARAAIKGKQSTGEILRYVERVTILEERYDLFCEASQWKKALEEATKMKDSRRVLNVKTLCNSPEIAMLADQILGRLT